MSTKIVHLSDTHSSPIKSNLDKPIEGNLLIHSGDISGNGSIVDVEKAIKDLALFKSDFDEIILIPGNHDWAFERSWGIMTQVCKDAGIVLLNDSGYEFEGIKIWGSPVQPWFHNWAFNRWRGEDIKKHWDLIPNNTDILVTHSPAYLKGDRVKHGEHVGCKDLLHKIEEIKPKLHISGHIHEGYGVYNNEHTLFFNASQLDQHYSLVNKPLVHIFEK